MPYRKCKRATCNELVNTKDGGYCPAHINDVKVAVKKLFEKLDKKKTPEDIAFYNDRKWKKVSVLFRINNPMCNRCKVKIATLVHHEPDRRELTRLGLSPYNSRYLEGLCQNCHNQELWSKKGK